jgi:hypothetical protein
VVQEQPIKVTQVEIKTAITVVAVVVEPMLLVEAQRVHQMLELVAPV